MAYEQMLGQGGMDVTTATVSHGPATVRPSLSRRGAPLPQPRVKNAMIRTIDIVVASVALVFISPLMIVVAVLCRLQDSGPVIFAQSRCGRGGQMFKCLKFRSMVVDADVRLAKLLESDPDARAEWTSTHKLVKDPRVTGLGRFLRKSSIDELPQLINVLRGEMSLVGPRPIVTGEIGRYGHYMDDYNSVLPGITGLWQVSGRSDTDYRRRVALDVLFIRKRSLGLYLYILFMTVPAVLLRKGAH